MIVLAAIAFDLGFKAVVLLSGRINILRNQTQDRSQQSMQGDESPFTPPESTNVTPNRKRKRYSSDEDLIEGGDSTESEDEFSEEAWQTPIDLNSTMGSDDMYWLTVGDKDVQNVKDIDVDELIRSTKLFAVLKKVPKSLESFVAFVEGDFNNSPWKRVCKSNKQTEQRKNEIKTKLNEFLSGPALIIDDECDDASIPSTQRQIEDKKGIPERMRRLRSMWPKNNSTNVCHYVGYSATPQANVLNHATDEFFPDFFWELPTQSGIYLGSQMYLDEELKKKVIKLIPYEDYPNLDLSNRIMPAIEGRRGLASTQEEFLENSIDRKNPSLSMKKFLAYYAFTGAIKIQRDRPKHDIDAVVAPLTKTRDPLSLLATSEEDLDGLRSKFEGLLDDCKENYHSLSNKEMRALFNNFNANYAEMFYKPNFKQSIILAKIEELVDCRIVLYIALDSGKFNTVTSETGNTKDNVYILYYKNRFYRLPQALNEVPPAKPSYHSAMIHASLSQDFIELMHNAVTAAWSIVQEEIKNHLSDIKFFEYIDDVWRDLSPDVPMTDFRHEIKKVLAETHIKTAMCRGGESITNMRTFDYTAVEGDRNAKNKPVPRFLIVIGGNMLSRGLTIEGLTVSWYTRSSRKSVADTTIQHQRWFGWRKGYIDLVRVFMQERHVSIFTEIVKCEKTLRNAFRIMGLHNWSPSRNSVVLVEPSNGILTNKGKNTTGQVKLHRFFEMKTPALDYNDSRAVLGATVNFWTEIATTVHHHRAGDVVMNVPLSEVIDYLTLADGVGMPDATELLRLFNIYENLCKERGMETRINVGVPTRRSPKQEEFEEFADADSQFILKNKLGLHKRKRNAIIYKELDQLLGGKSQNTPRDKHQYIDAVVDNNSPLPDWIVLQEDDSSDDVPSSRGPNAPVLLLIYFLHPRFRSADEGYYEIGAKEAGRFPLVALAACFPDIKTGWVANSSVPKDTYVYPQHQDDEDPFGRQRKRAKMELQQAPMDYIDDPTPDM